MEQEGSDGWDSDVPEVEDVTPLHQDFDADSDAWGDASDESGWFDDPDVEGQERYFDGSEWTSETRSVESDEPLSHLPDHAGELQRALAAATDDIHEVEDRLGNLFQRVEQRGKQEGRGRKEAAVADDRREPDAHAFAADDDEADEEENWLSGESVDVADDRDDDDESDDDTVAEIDEENWLSDDDDEDLDIGDGDDIESDGAVAESDEEDWLSDDDEDLDVGDGDRGERVEVARAEVETVHNNLAQVERVDVETLHNKLAQVERVDVETVDLEDDDALAELDDDDALAELDEELASEAPEKVKRGFFRRN